MKYFISLISALLFTFTVFAQGVLEIKQSRQTLKNLLADDQAQNIVDVFIVVIEALTVHLGQLHDLLDRYPAAGLGGDQLLYGIGNSLFGVAAHKRLLTSARRREPCWKWPGRPGPGGPPASR